MPHLIFITLCVNFMIIVSAAPGQSKHERLIDALITSVNITYNDDGAADATVTQRPNKAVRQIIALKSEALPFLISHLADQRLSIAKFKNKRVPVGHICLDILTNITKGHVIHIKDCFDDGLGACIDPGYYYRPDVAKRVEMRKVERAWARAFQAGKIKFQYPKWLK